MADLENRERGWEKKPEAGGWREDAALRLGAGTGELELLSGGLANTNVRVGQDKVLRIYRQDPGRLAMEAALLQRPWQSFSVPKLLDSGADFLVLSYVPHQPLQDSAAHGEAVGRALAEIHAIRLERWGLLDSRLGVTEEFPDLMVALAGYAASCFEKCLPAFQALKRPVLDFLKGRQGAMMAATGKPCLVHSDFKVSNLHLTASGKPLVLDWETAYSGSPLSDMGQLFRWKPSAEFQAGFERGYPSLPRNWKSLSEAFDLINLAGLLPESTPDSRRGKDLAARIQETLR